MKEKIKVVIIGGGFGGVYTARNLQSHRNLDITLISRKPYFLFTPLLHEVATGGLSPMSVAEPIHDIFDYKKVHFVEDDVKGIDPVSKMVKTTNDSIPYDYLIVSLGAETNYYGTRGAQEHTYSLKDLSDALDLRKRLLENPTSCAIVGAGPTGVELATEIVEFIPNMKVHVITATPDVLSQFPPELRVIAQKEMVRKGIHIMANESVVEVLKGKILFADKSFLEADTIVWVAGVKANDITIAGAEKEKNGRLKINESLQVTGVPHVFALGDISGTAPMLAQVAVQQGKVVAENIMATIAGSPLKPFVFKEKGLLVSLGQWYAAGKLFGVILKGPVMWWIWRTIYLFNFHSWKKRFKISREWTVNLFRKRDTSKPKQSFL